MAKILFVDDRIDEILTLWNEEFSRTNHFHVLLPVRPFETIEQTLRHVKRWKPDVIAVGYGLGKELVTGADVVRALRESNFRGKIISNSGGGIQSFLIAGVTVDASCNRHGLRKVIDDLEAKERELAWQRNAQLKDLLQQSEFDQAKRVVESATNYLEAENFVSTTLNGDSSELVETALNIFLNVRESYSQLHQLWVHSLSHFSSKLWDRRMDSWIKRLYESAFDGAKEVNNTSCLDRLVNDFAKYARFDDKPEDFCLTQTNLRLIDWEGLRYAKARIDAGFFSSETEFLSWKLRRPETHTIFDYGAQIKLVDRCGVRVIIRKLCELGADTNEFADLEKNLLTQELSKLEEKLSTESVEWMKKRLEKGIQITNDALTELGR
jgi:hypothetical protein